MKIGLLTFHWAANHGAVLQSYASVKYLQDTTPHEIEIIDYCSKGHELTLKNALRPNRPAIVWEKIKTVCKERKIADFRKKLPLSKRYYTNRQLIEETPDYDVLISGSDQVWNPSYLLHGDGRNVLTPVYFLNFGKTGCKKLGLSVSFGCVQYPSVAAEQAKRYVQDFCAIGVRENSGVDILREWGQDAVVTADPTALLSGEEYKALCCGYAVSEKPYIAISVLRSQKRNVKNTVDKLKGCFPEAEHKNIADLSIEGWLAGIRDAQAVITNSFHCVMMCLKLHTPFYVITEKQGKVGMNDRFYTLLERFDLSGRMIAQAPATIDDLPAAPIDWEAVDRKMEEYAGTLKQFLAEHLS